MQEMEEMENMENMEDMEGSTAEQGRGRVHTSIIYPHNPPTI